MLSGEKTGSNFSIPLEYLQGVQPSIGDHAWVASGSSEWTHKIVKVTRISGEVAWVTQDDDSFGDEAAADTALEVDKLIKVQKWA